MVVQTSGLQWPVFHNSYLFLWGTFHRSFTVTAYALRHSMFVFLCLCYYYYYYVSDRRSTRKAFSYVCEFVHMSVWLSISTNQGP